MLRRAGTRGKPALPVLLGRALDSARRSIEVLRQAKADLDKMRQDGPKSVAFLTEVVC